MKMKKIVSVTAALAITMSAFAGLSITARAADTGKPAKLTEDYTVVNASTDGWTLESSRADAPATMKIVQGEGLKLASGYDGSRRRHGTMTKMFDTSYDGDVTLTMTVRNYDSTSANSTDQANRLAYFTILDNNKSEIIKFAEDGQGRNAMVDGVVVDYNSSGYRGSTWTVKVDMNFAQGTLNYSIDTGLGKNATGSKQISATSLGGLQLVSCENISSNSENKGALGLQNFSVYQDEVTTQYYDYTVEYQDTNNNNTVVKTEKGKAEADSIIPYSSERFTSDVNSKMYIVDGIDDSSDKNVKEDNSAKLVVKCHEAASYPINVYSSLDTEKTSPLYSHTMREGDAAITFAYHKYRTANDLVTETAKKSTFTKTITAQAAAEAQQNGGNMTIEYTKYTGIAQFKEGEDITGSSQVTDQGPLSNGAGGQIGRTAYEAITVKESGLYKVTVVAYSRNVTQGNLGANVKIYKQSDDQKILAQANVDKSYNNAVTITGENIQLNSGDVLMVQGYDSGESPMDHGTNACVDYVLIEKTGDLATFTTKTDFGKVQSTENGVLRFIADVKENVDITETGYGFMMVNFSDLNGDNPQQEPPEVYSGDENDGTGIKNIKVGSGDIETDSSFYYDITDIPQTAQDTHTSGDAKVEKVNMYAVPYIVYSGTDGDIYLWGSPFTHDGALDWNNEITYSE